MGQTEAKLTQVEVEALANETSFTEEEIRKLFHKFVEIDTDKSGTITCDELEELPGLMKNPLVNRIFGAFDTNQDDRIDFREFIDGFSMFFNKASIQEKMNYLFRIYDIDCDGVISNKDLYLSLKPMVGGNLTDVQLQQVVDKTIRMADLDRDGVVSEEEFYRVRNTKLSGDIPSNNLALVQFVEKMDVVRKMDANISV